MLPKTIPTLGLDDLTAASAMKSAAAIKPDSDDSTLLMALKEVNKALTLDQRKLLLRKAANLP